MTNQNIHFHQSLFLLYLSLGSETAESFHVTISRELNSRIVVPTAGNVKKFKPRLPKPVVENPTPVLVSAPKRPMVLDSWGTLILDHDQVPAKVLRLVKSKKNEARYFGGLPKRIWC